MEDSSRRWLKRNLAVAALLVTTVGCMPEFENPHLKVRDLTEEDLKAPPGRVEIKAAVINDIRERRSLHLHIDEGQRAVPQDIKLDKYGFEAVRTHDNFELWRITVRQDSADQVHAVSEVAYWDNEQKAYYYRYEGGTPYREVWMGPFPVKFSKPPQEHESHGH
jgi:hypothetical protein